MTGDPQVVIRPVADDQWEIVGWLWQLLRHDLALIVQGLPYADGRYQWAWLRDYPHADGAGYLAWRPHPNTAEPAPVAFALVRGLLSGEQSMVAFWVSPVLRRTGIGRQLAVEVLTRHTGRWSIAFQHDNRGAGIFWRAVADEAFGVGRWSEQQRPVPERPELPMDHWIEHDGAPVDR